MYILKIIFKLDILAIYGLCGAMVYIGPIHAEQLNSMQCDCLYGISWLRFRSNYCMGSLKHSATHVGGAGFMKIGDSKHRAMKHVYQ